jgi:hypothetical protein
MEWRQRQPIRKTLRLKRLRAGLRAPVTMTAHAECELFTMRSGCGGPRRGNRRGVRKGGTRVCRITCFPVEGRRFKKKQCGDVRKFLLFQIQGRVGFLLSVFAFGNVLAQRAGMFAVESLNNCFRERGLARISGHHARPGECLAKRPMQPNGTGQRQHDCEPGKPGKHDVRIGN